MSALDWIKARTTETIEEPIEFEGVTYAITRHYFRGVLPYRMRRELGKVELISTEEIVERVLCNPKTGLTEYWRTVYTPAA